MYTRKPFQNRSQSRITFETLFFRIYVNFGPEMGAQTGTGFPGKSVRKGEGFEDQDWEGKGKGREVKGVTEEILRQGGGGFTTPLGVNLPMASGPIPLWSAAGLFLRFTCFCDSPF